VAVCALAGCKQPTLGVGGFRCSGEGIDGGPSAREPVAVPWETGFENGPCDYYDGVAGFCYSFPPATFRVVTEPVHGGRYAAEITVVTGTDAGAQPQGRCARQGLLPVEAYYGAWFLIPKPTANRGLWNLFHFRTEADPGPAGLWDVSLTQGEEPRLELWTGRFSLGSGARVSPPVPLGRWFHVVLYLKRAPDASGAIALYLGDEQGDQKVVEFTDLITDDSDWAQWYVGNLAEATDPADCTVYLDDVTIRSSL